MNNFRCIWLFIVWPSMHKICARVIFQNFYSKSFRLQNFVQKIIYKLCSEKKKLLYIFLLLMLQDKRWSYNAMTVESCIYNWLLPLHVALAFLVFLFIRWFRVVLSWADFFVLNMDFF